jgi:hypothetical protein
MDVAPLIENQDFIYKYRFKKDNKEIVEIKYNKLVGDDALLFDRFKWIYIENNKKQVLNFISMVGQIRNFKEGQLIISVDNKTATFNGETYNNMI